MMNRDLEKGSRSKVVVKPSIFHLYNVFFPSALTLAHRALAAAAIFARPAALIFLRFFSLTAGFSAFAAPVPR